MSASILLAAAATVGTCAAVASVLLLLSSPWLQRRKQASLPPQLRHTPWSAELRVGMQAALAAGAKLKAAIDADKHIDFKGKIDMVTDTDKQNEELIAAAIAARFPTDEIIGEEGSAASGNVPPLTNARTWIIDPIDGTTNFVHTFPFTCVSIGYAVGGTVKIGIVYNPVLEELFVAATGYGAYLNGRKLRTSSCKTLDAALVLSEFGYQREPSKLSTILLCVQRVCARGARGYRQLGSGALDLCYVGAGRLDCLFAGVAGEGWSPWDYAAGMVVVQEAGGVLCEVDGSPFHTHSSSVMAAATPELRDELITVLGDSKIKGE